MRLRQGLFLLLLLPCIFPQEIVDYSHTASIQKTQLDSTKRYDISISSSRLNSQLLDFPQACSRNRELLTNEIVERDRLPLNNQEDFLNQLKTNMTTFLRLSEKIKNYRTYLTQDNKQLPQASEKYPVESDQLEELKEHQNSLLRINSSIEEKVKSLSQLIFEEINRTKDSGFNELRLNFEFSSYQSRLRFLQELKKTIGKQPIDNDSKSKKISEYFSDVNYGFSLQNKNLDHLNSLLDNFAANSALKLKITNEMKKLQAKNHIIKNKQDCRIKNIKPINQQNQKHIQDITHKLRHLKKIESGNKQHCQGVALKLLTQIKKVLKAYNYSHTCSQGLDGFKKEKILIEEKLRTLEDQYNNLGYDPTFKKIQLYFNQTRSEKEIFIQEISTFDLNYYALNPQILDAEISSVKTKLKNIRYQLEHPPEGDVKPFDHQKVRERIKEINQQQHNYCKIKDQYEATYRVIEKAVNKYQFRVGQSVAKHEEYLRKLNELNQLEKEFNDLRVSLLKAIE